MCAIISSEGIFVRLRTHLRSYLHGSLTVESAYLTLRVRLGTARVVVGMKAGRS